MLTLVRSLVSMECHSRAKLTSMAWYLGDFQTLFHRLLMTDPTVEEIMVAVLLQSLPRDPTWPTFVSNLLQYSKDERLTVQHVMDRVLSFDSGRSTACLSLSSSVVLHESRVRLPTGSCMRPAPTSLNNRMFARHFQVLLEVEPKK